MPIIDINLVLLGAFTAWHYSLFCGYISDDHSAVAQRKDIIPDEEKVDRGEGFWTKRFNDGLVMFYHNKIFWSLGFREKPFFWHLFSLSIHLLNTYLLYLFLIPIMGENAVYAAAVWSVNPMLNQNVVWISGRPYLFGLCFALIAMICWFNPFVFIPFYLLAVLTNISIFFVPVILWIIHPGTPQTSLYLFILLAGALPILIWKFNARFTRGLVIDRDNFKFKLRKINVLAKIYLYYLYCLISPTKMGWYHQAGFRYNEKWEKFNYLTLAGYIFVGVLIFKVGLPGWIYLLGILPNSNIYATNSFVQDRYLYFGAIGIAMIVAPFLAQYPAVFFCVMTFYITRAYMHSRSMKNDEKVYRENWKNHPNSDYAVNNLSFFLIQQQRYDEARVVIERGLNINNMNKMLWYNLGITWAARGNFQSDEGKFNFIRALDCWKMCLQIEPRWKKPADDLTKLIKLLVDKKVLSMSPPGEEGGVSISIPNLIGVKEVLNQTTA